MARERADEEEEDFWAERLIIGQAAFLGQSPIDM